MPRTQFLLSYTTSLGQTGTLAGNSLHVTDCLIHTVLTGTGTTIEIQNLVASPYAKISADRKLQLETAFLKRLARLGSFIAAVNAQIRVMVEVDRQLEAILSLVTQYPVPMIPNESARTKTQEQMVSLLQRLTDTVAGPNSLAAHAALATRFAFIKGFVLEHRAQTEAITRKIAKVYSYTVITRFAAVKALMDTLGIGRVEAEAAVRGGDSEWPLVLVQSPLNRKEYLSAMAECKMALTEEGQQWWLGGVQQLCERQDLIFVGGTHD